jgi:hypothetical protein
MSVIVVVDPSRAVSELLPVDPRRAPYLPEQCPQPIGYLTQANQGRRSLKPIMSSRIIRAAPFNSFFVTNCWTSSDCHSVIGSASVSPVRVEILAVRPFSAESFFTIEENKPVSQFRLSFFAPQVHRAISMSVPVDEGAVVRTDEPKIFEVFCGRSGSK